jgi:hypothetical protein
MQKKNQDPMTGTRTFMKEFEMQSVAENCMMTDDRV